jgi:hypothetical protein
VTVLIRLPTGGQSTRRFDKSSPLSLLFDFVEAGVAVDLSIDPDSYALEVRTCLFFD